MRAAPLLMSAVWLLLVTRPGLAQDDIDGRLNRLVKQLCDARKPEVRREAMGELGKLAKQVRNLVAEFAAVLRDDRDEGIRLQAAAALEEIGPSAYPAAKALADALFDKSPAVRAKAAEALGQIGPGAEEAIPDLVFALRDKVAFVRRRAAGALGVLRANPKLAVPGLIQALQDEDRAPDRSSTSVPVVAALALANYGPEAKAAVPALLKALEGRDADLRLMAIRALGKIKADLPTLLPLLRRILNDPSQEAFRTVTAVALGNLGPEASEAVPDLLKALECQNLQDPPRAHWIRSDVLDALGKISAQTEHIVPAVINLCKNPGVEEALRSTAIQTLGRLRPVAKETVPFLIRCLNDKGPGRDDQAICNGLKNVGKAAVPALLDNLRTQQGYARIRTMTALRMMGADAVEALPALEAELTNPVRFHRNSAAMAIYWIKRRSAPSLRTGP